MFLIYNFFQFHYNHLLLLFYYLQNQKDKILGFLDNDPCKIGKRVYGSPLLTYSPSILKTHQNEKIYVLLYAGVYIEEIKKQYLSLNPLIEFIDSQ